MKNNPTHSDVVINNEQDTVTVSLNIPDYIKKICAHLDLSYEHLEITLLSKDAITQLNQDYFDHHVPTDTISFNLTPDASITGDVYLCPAVILENSTTYSLDFDEELKIVLIHSILHLIGYADDTPENYTLMKESQDRIYQQLNQ